MTDMTSHGQIDTAHFKAGLDLSAPFVELDLVAALN